MSEKVSIIIPCYNVEKYIDRCLESIVKQTIGVSAIQIVCVNDHSSDRTGEKLRAWENKYPGTIVVIMCERNNRQGGARNIGLQYASGEWVSFIDSDDWIEPDFFEKLFKKAGENTFDIVACRAADDSSTRLRLFGPGEDKGSGESENVFVTDDMMRVQVLRSQMFGRVYPSIVRRSFISTHRLIFPERLMYEDIFYKELLHMEVSRGALIHEVLYHHYVEQDPVPVDKDAYTHVDYLTVLSKLWREWGRRGYYSRYENELLAEFMKAGYLGFLRIIIFEYEEPPYSLFCLLKELMLTLTPAADKKHYLRNYPNITVNQKVWIEALWGDVDKDDFLMLAKNTKEAGSL